MHDYFSFSPLSLRGELIENCSTCKMEHHHILLVLFMYGLSTIRLLGGLGVEDRQKGRREVTILLRVIFLWGSAKDEVCRSKPKNTR